MPPFILAVFLILAALLLISPGDYIGEIKGIISASTAFALYLLSQRSRRKRAEEAQRKQGNKDLYDYTADKEKRLEERDSRLRQEEREFAHSQIALSRERGHILARAYMSIWMKSEELIQLLHDNHVEVPRRLLTQETHAQVLGELKEVEDRQAGITVEQEHKPKV